MGDPNFINSREEDSLIGEKISNIFFYFIKRIHWFILSTIICLSFAYFKIKEIIPTYKASASILIKDDNNSGFFQEASAFQDIDYYNSMYYPLDNEIAVLKSRNLIQNVISDLKLNVQFFSLKDNKVKELFEKLPFRITFLEGDSSIYNESGFFKIMVKSEKSFEIVDEKNGIKISGNFGSPINTSLGELILIPQNNSIGNSYQLVITPFERKITEISKSIVIEKMTDYANVILISYTDPNEFKAKAIINSLIDEHQKDVISDKNQVAKNSAKFINERIDFISKELDNVEDLVKNFKSSNNVFDVISEKDLFLETKGENDQQLLKNEMELKLIIFLKSYIEGNEDPTLLIPSNAGIEDNSLAQNVELHNNLVLERNRIIKTSGEKNPVAVNLAAKILSLQDNIKLSIKRYESGVKIKIQELYQNKNKIQSNLVSLPAKEKQLREIQRQQQIKEELYLYLLQKREETAITLSLTVPNSKVIDYAFCEAATFSPNKRSVFFIAFIISLIIPILFFLIKEKLNTKIKDNQVLEDSGIKILSELSKYELEKETPIFKTNELNAFAESFRLLRTNVDLILALQDNKNKVVIITSTLPNEGKTFISLNLAKSMSILGKKVVVVGMDLRSPKLSKFLKIENQRGVSNFVVDNKLTLKDITIKNPGEHGFDLVSSGDIPPNPTEVILHNRVKTLFDELEKEYDYIIVDTPPVGVVADTILLNKFANMFIYVIRHNFLEKKFIKFISKIQKEEKLKNLYFVSNYTDLDLTYGYKYGYYYSDINKSRFSKFIDFFRK
jgi:capsular exopolysaccharide synthesis family protein